MHPLQLAIGCAWLVFWIYWLASASSSKESVGSGWRTRLTGVSAVGVFLIAGVLRGGSLAVHSLILAAIGALLFACGIALAVWARLHLGRNWGMPTSITAGSSRSGTSRPLSPRRTRSTEAGRRCSSRSSCRRLVRAGSGGQQAQRMPVPGRVRPVPAASHARIWS
jgi:hypothetical protein